MGSWFSSFVLVRNVFGRRGLGFLISIFLTSISFSSVAGVAAVPASIGTSTGSENEGAVAGGIDTSKFKKFESKFMGRKIQKSPDQKLRDVSDMYEKHFLREMMKSMRSTVKEGGFIQSSSAEKIFKEQLDEQYVEKWGERGGIGLSDMIYNQLIDKFGVALGIKSAVARPQGPLSFDAKSGNRAQAFRHPGKKDSMSYRIDPKPVPPLDPGVQEVSMDGSRDVKAPWSGVLLGTKTMADNQTMLEIQHDNGLKSQVVFKGGLSKVSTGQKLQAGDTLGFLSSEAKSLYWTVETMKGPGPQTVSE